MSLLKRLFGRSPAAPAPLPSQPFTAALAPEAAFFAVGDVHGCLPQLRSLMDKMNAADSAANIIFVGDYIDRGEDSAGVLHALHELQNDPRVICLAGNHEDMLLKFIDDPEKNGSRWLRYGGLQTLASFGVGGINANSNGDALLTAAEQLKATMGPDLLTWIRDMPITWSSGNVAVVHAGANPYKPIQLQTSKTLMWGHKDFDTVNRDDGIWVLHGHTIVDEAHARDGRIAIDTGAYATGVLTAAHVQSTGVTFLKS